MNDMRAAFEASRVAKVTTTSFKQYNKASALDGQHACLGLARPLRRSLCPPRLPGHWLARASCGRAPGSPP